VLLPVLLPMLVPVELLTDVEVVFVERH
jgi:hypothetical protein